MIVITFLLLFYLGTPALCWYLNWYSWNREYMDEDAFCGSIFIYWIILFVTFVYVIGRHT